MSDLSIREQLRISASISRRAFKLTKEQVRELNAYIVSLETFKRTKEQLAASLEAGEQVKCARCGVEAKLTHCPDCDDSLCSGCYAYPCDAAPPTMPYDESPEETGNWKCLKCGNVACFVGVDDHGGCGEGDHEDECNGEDCKCEVTLAQYVNVSHCCVLGYSSHEGGGSGAEINSYTRIYCGECMALLWKDVEVEETLPLPI